MSHGYLQIESSVKVKGDVELLGAKNAVLVTIASLLLTNGKSRLKNVPASSDVLHMLALLEHLGAEVSFNTELHTLEVDTTKVTKWQVPADIMNKMRASILVMGPLLARFGHANIALPGGCVIGSRPIDYHLKNFEKMGAKITEDGHFLHASTSRLNAERIVLEYPSVGATENIMMGAVLANGTTTIVNAALEPEVLDLIAVLKKMGAKIEILPPATIMICGVEDLYPIEHSVIVDRLEAGALLLAAAITGGEITIKNALPDIMDVFLYKLEEMGHLLHYNSNKEGVLLKATKNPKAVSFKTGPYPSFPTDLQAPMMAAQCLADGKSVIEETVFENRLLHVRELQKMGAQIQVSGNKATITGVDALYGAQVIATDIRASCALVLAGMVAEGKTIMTGIHHWQRGYDALEKKLMSLGANIKMKFDELPLLDTAHNFDQAQV